ncbi:MAG: ATP-binding protein [Solirubrobacterales bacterium]|nr:ATP-binding protein [Solirubrobacterales bacterium]MBV9535649.1 ATP-binding protein [Solirubrobacterales bacterium]
MSTTPTHVQLDASIVRLEMASTPECGTFVRAALAGVSGPLGWSGELVDDLKTAATEACNNAVLHAYRGGVGRVVVRLMSDSEWLELVVCDEGEGLHGVSASEDRLRVGLPVMSALADRVEFVSPPDGGTEVRMVFRTGSRGPTRPAQTEQRGASAEQGQDTTPIEDVMGWSAESPASLIGEPSRALGDVAGVVSPVGLLGPALGRLVRALAAVSHFRLDRFSELSVLTDTLGAHARAAASERLAFALCNGERWLELAAGPFTPGSGVVFTGNGVGQPASPLRNLVDDLRVERGDSGEIVKLVISDPR